MNPETHAEIIPADNSTVDAMEGIFVVADTDGETVTFPETTRGGESEKRIIINLSNNTTLIDRAIIRFDEGQTLPKFQIHENSTKIYIPQDGKDYAIVNANEMGEMPVNSSLLTVLRSLRIAPYQWRGNEDPKGSHSILKALKFR